MVLMGKYNNRDETRSLDGIKVGIDEDIEKITPHTAGFLDAFELFDGDGRDAEEDIKIMEEELASGKVVGVRAIARAFAYGHMVAMTRVARAKDEAGDSGVQKEIRDFKMVMAATKLATQLRKRMVKNNVVT